jgi:hypothetical protein
VVPVAEPGTSVLRTRELEAHGIWRGKLQEAAQFYDARVTGLGADFLEELDGAIQRILQFSGSLGGDFRTISALFVAAFSIHRHLYHSNEAGDSHRFGIHKNREPMSWDRNL